jgi:hypothetical protein
VDSLFGEDGSLVPIEHRAPPPVLDPELLEETVAGAPGERIRVVIVLDYQPQAEIIRRNHETGAEALEPTERGIEALVDAASARQDPRSETDAHGYESTYLDAGEQSLLRTLQEEHEALTARIMGQAASELRLVIEASQIPVVVAVESLGGEVEFTTIAGNMVVASVPVAAVTALAEIPGVRRVAGDRVAAGHLDVAGGASGAADLDGLWSNGHTGGSYDPAVIDSGIDLAHPAMANGGPSPLPRENHWSWYLLGAAGDPDFADVGAIDDLQGHGTQVAGSVGSYGSTGYEGHLGMAHGVEKFVHLKAGWLRASDGGAAMYWTDKYNLVDRALNRRDELLPNFGVDDFADDVDGFNLSYGADTALDDTDAGRFWDSVVHSYPDTIFTVSAGNGGPGNVLFSDPAVSYNGITVASARHEGTVPRDDDTIDSTSTRGPTAAGRRKPDLAAHGSSITAPNHEWETEDDMVARTGTSMAAPAVLGIALDLMDAGVQNGMAIKALLLNTAQKNEPGIAIEDDADGWDPAAGFGLVGAQAAFYHRGDLHLGSVTERPLAGHYQLYLGSMRDEGPAGEGRDRATLVWNRHVSYETSPGNPPLGAYAVSDLNLRLYRESDDVEIDADLTVPDNVQQVRVAPGQAADDFVVKVYAWSHVFAHPDPTEPYALATEEDFVAVDLPASFQGFAVWPAQMEPNEVANFDFWVRNDSVVASHGNLATLALPGGWTLEAGAEAQDLGSVAGGGGPSATASWTLRAPGSAVGAQALVSSHTHNSYGEAWGPFHWGIGVDVSFDTTPPIPDPSSWESAPAQLSSSEIQMTATEATDDRYAVEYSFEVVGSPTGGTGASDSGWVPSDTFTDSALETNHDYCYHTRARDTASTPNATDYSPTSCRYTDIEASTGITFGAITSTSIEARSSNTPSGLTRGSSGLVVFNLLEGVDSGWKQDNAFWTNVGLVPNSEHLFAAQTRNGDAAVISIGPTSSRYTLANAPIPAGLLVVGDLSIQVSWLADGNSAGTEYMIENQTLGSNSGWIAALSWDSTGLALDTTYSFRGMARNGENVETEWVDFGSATTPLCANGDVDGDGDGICDADDNCSIAFNPGQHDSNSDGYGNYCDPDLDGDGIVGIPDFNAFRSAFGSTAGSGSWNPDADFNSDGAVGIPDFNILRSYFGNPPGPSGLACAGTIPCP